MHFTICYREDDLDTILFLSFTGHILAWIKFCYKGVQVSKCLVTVLLLTDIHTLRQSSITYAKEG